MAKNSTIAAVVLVALGIGGGVYYQQYQTKAANAPDASAKGEGGAAKGDGKGGDGKGGDGKSAKGGDGKGGDAKGQRGAPVMVAPVEQRDVPVTINVAGRTEAFASVTLRARVDGLITNVHYKPGQKVKKGQVMITLDDRAMRAQVDQVAANLARDRAQLDKAKADMQRQTDLMNKGFISQATLDGFKATVDTLEATVKADLAALDLSRVNLTYATITAPMDGIAGATLAFPGGNVKSSDTPLVVVNQTNPLYVTFSLPESQLKEISRERASAKLPVQARAPGAGGKVATGELAFLDNTVDTATGTILLKARLDNADEQFTPGQFVEVSLTVREIAGALLIPTEALQAGPNGNFVYVAKPDQTVELRMVQTMPATRTTLIVEKGLKPGDRVVTDGQLRLTPGARYEVRTPGGPSGGPGGAPGKGGGGKGGEGAKGDSAKGEAPKGDAPKGDAPKGDTSKTSAPKGDAAAAPKN